MQKFQVNSSLLAAVVMAGAMITTPVAASEHYAAESSGSGPIRIATQLVLFESGDGRLLEQLRSSLMASVAYVVDGSDYASLSAIPDARQNGVGDCKSISVAMRNMLIAQGFPADSLLLATGKTERGEPHMVLLIRGKERGKEQTRVFDIRARSITSLEELMRLGYSFDGIQSAGGDDAVLVRWNGRRYL